MTPQTINPHSTANASSRLGTSLLESNHVLATFSKPDAGAVPDYKATKVNSAYAKIRSTFLQPRIVWKDELSAISNTIERLAPTERRALVNLLARAPASNNESLLTRWLGRTTIQGIGAFDGLNPTELSKLWKQLVPGQDKRNLARIFSAIGEPASTARHYPDATRLQFAQTVAATATAQQKLDFAIDLRADALAGSKFPASNSSGRAIAMMMASTKAPDLFSAYTTALGRGGMDAVVQASVPVQGSLGMGPVDTSLYRSLASSVARSDNPRTKAAFVAASGKVIDAVYNGGANGKSLGEVSTALSTVIGTDTNRIMENVMLQNTTRGGSSGPAALRSYVQALLDSGKSAADIGAITLQLQRGSDLKEDPAKYLAQRESRSAEQPSHVRARVLGGWLGLVGSAVQSRTGRRDANAAYASLIFTGTLDVLKELVGARFPGLKVAVGVATPALKAAVNAGLLTWRNQAAQADRGFVQGLIDGAVPRYASGVEVTADWTQTMKNEQTLRFTGR